VYGRIIAERLVYTTESLEFATKARRNTAARPSSKKDSRRRHFFLLRSYL